MRRILLLLVGCVLALGSVAHAQESKVLIRKVELEDFPRVQVTVSAGEVEPEDVQLYENDVLLEEVEISTLAESGGTIDVVLAIDTSGSMEGAAFEAAQTAATDFIASIPEHIRVGVVAFSDQADKVLDITDDHDAALAAVAGLSATGETALYDAVTQASRMFDRSAQNNIILLSDGADTASSASLKRATSRSVRAGAAIFAVGLETEDTDVAALKRLARKTGGRYSPADAADLSGVYEGLATELKKQYVLEYESAAQASSQLRLMAATPAGSDTVLVLAPDADPEPVVSPQPLPPPAKSKPALHGTAGLVITLTLTFTAAFGAVFFSLRTLKQVQRDRRLGRAMSMAPPAPVRDEQPRSMGQWLPQSLVSTADRLVQKRAVGSSLNKKLESAGLPLRAGEYVAGTGVALVAGALLGLMLLQSVPLALLSAMMGAATPYVLLSRRIRIRSRKLHAQLPDILTVLAGSLRAGHSFLQALDAASKEIGDPGAGEFGRVVAEIRLGRPVDEALEAMADRVKSDDFHWAVLAVNIQREVGGNLAELLDTVADTIRERQTVRRQVQVLSTEGRMSIGILATLPIGIALYIAAVNPEYLALLFSSNVGIVMVAVASCLLVVGIAWMKKVVKIDV